MTQRDRRSWTSPEEQARDEIGDTAVRPPVARILVLLCLLPVVIVPLVRLTGAAPFADFAAGLPAVARVFAADGFFAANRAALARIDDFEDRLERGSPVLGAVLPYGQWLLARWGGVGNERVVLGRGGAGRSGLGPDGWLYFRPGVEYSTGRPFLDPETLERRRRGGPSWRRPVEPDPRPAILDFARQLRSRGIDLVVVPTPSKTMIHPEALAPALADREHAAPESLHNPSFALFAAGLEAAGVEVFDPAPMLLAARRDDPKTELFLRTDSHWRPAAVDAVARALAERLRPLLPAAGARVPWRRERAAHQALGDLGRMLELPPWQGLYPEERIELERVVDPEGGPWRPDPAAAVLVLGDSFTNVFSRDDLGWGTAAGLAERLAFHLGRPVDRIAVNDGAASATRRRLAEALAAGDDRLAGKRVVVYQFAVRELTTGDWQPVALPEPPAVPPPAAAPPREGIVVRGRVVAAAPLPDPRDTPYRDAILALHLVDVEPPAGSIPEEILVYAWGMRDNRPSPASRYRAGQLLELRLVPWAAVAGELESYQRLEIDSEETFLLDAYWAKEHDIVE